MRGDAGHDLRHEEDAAADDVRDDDRRGVEHAEPGLEAGRLDGVPIFCDMALSPCLAGAVRRYRFFSVTANRPKKTVSSCGSVVTALM